MFRKALNRVAPSEIYGYASSNPLTIFDSLGLDSEFCTRAIKRVPKFLPPRHCFFRFNGNDDDTISFDLDGVHSDPAPIGAQCIKTNGPQDDTCIKQRMAECTGYHFFKNNCCHCVERALQGCGQSIPTTMWPNYPINPGPQPEEEE
jgi:hypothetical protein